MYWGELRALLVASHTRPDPRHSERPARLSESTWAMIVRIFLRTHYDGLISLIITNLTNYLQEALRILFVLLVKKTNVALSRISRETTDLFHGPRYSVIAGKTGLRHGHRGGCALG